MVLLNFVIFLTSLKLDDWVKREKNVTSRYISPCAFSQTFEIHQITDPIKTLMED